jgi:hypothetical protein
MRTLLTVMALLFLSASAFANDGWWYIDRRGSCIPVERGISFHDYVKFERDQGEKVEIESWPWRGKAYLLMWRSGGNLARIVLWAPSADDCLAALPDWKRLVK